MKTMEDYTIRCTSKQTEKAIELGAPIERKVLCSYGDREISIPIYPTAEQMRGWLMEKLGAKIFTTTYYSCYKEDSYGYSIVSDKVVLEVDSPYKLLHSDKEAIFAAIDAALEYLSLHRFSNI